MTLSKKVEETVTNSVERLSEVGDLVLPLNLPNKYVDSPMNMEKIELKPEVETMEKMIERILSNTPRQP